MGTNLQRVTIEALGALIRAHGEVTPDWQEDGTYTEITARLLGYLARFHRDGRLLAVENPAGYAVNLEQTLEALAWLTLQTHWQR